MIERQITSADDGTNVPSDAGIRMDSEFAFTIVGGTTIAAALQMKTGFGNWALIPDADSKTTITGATAIALDLPAGMYRLAVTTATGTWDMRMGEID